MMNSPYIKIAALLVLVTLAGCVSTSKYEALAVEKNQEITSLQRERDALEEEKISLQGQKSALEQEKASLDQDKRMLEQEKTALEQDKETLEQQRVVLLDEITKLEQQKNALLASGQQSQAQYESLVRQLSDEVEKGQLKVRQYQNMLTVDAADQIFFDSGRTEIKDSGKAVLKKLAEALKSYDTKIIRVVGHTDNVPVAKSIQKTYPTNWELSVARATNVVRYLQEVGIPPERMIASGRGEYAPLAANDSPEGRQKNRRIEILLIDKSLLEEIPKQVN